MQLNFQVLDLKPFPTLAEPTQIFPTIYFDRQIYAATVPHTPFTDGLFCPNSAQISLPMDDNECLELLQRYYFYVVLNTLAPPKKAKKPADGSSYPELVLQPFAQTSPIKIDVFSAALENGRRRIAIYQQLPVYDGKCMLQCKVDGFIPDYERFRPIQIAIGGVTVGGNLQNLYTQLPKGLPPCRWDALISLPQGRKITIYNGFFRTKENKLPDEVKDLQDLLAICQTKAAVLEFPRICAHHDLYCAEAGFQTLYTLIGEPKTAEKLCYTELYQYNYKALQASLKTLGYQAFIHLVETLREAVEAALTSVVLDKNYRVLEELQHDAKKKVDTKSMIYSVKVLVEKPSDFLAFEQFENNYATLFLRDEEVDQLRQLSARQVEVEVVPSRFWADIYELDVEEFKCAGALSLEACLREKVVCGDVVLQMTQHYLELVEKPLEVTGKDKDKRKANPKDIYRKYENVLTSNYALLGIAFNFVPTNIIRTRYHFVSQIKQQILTPQQLFWDRSTDLLKKLQICDYLPPSRESLSPRDQVLQRLGIAVQEAFYHATQATLEELLSPLVKKFTGELKEVVPQASSAEIFATLVTTAKTALKQAHCAQKSPEALLRFGNVLLQSSSVEDAERAAALFGKALARERAQTALFEHTEALELCVLGSLKSAIVTKNKQLLERCICRVFAISQLNNSSVLFNTELAMLAAAEVFGMGEDSQLALLLLHCCGDIYCFEESNTARVVYELLFLTFIYAVYEQTNGNADPKSTPNVRYDDGLTAELKLLLVDYLRQVNIHQTYFSGLENSDPDDVCIIHLKLALADWLIARRSTAFAYRLLDGCVLQEFLPRAEVPNSFAYDWQGFFKSDSIQTPAFSLQISGKADSRHVQNVVRQLSTKLALLQARIYYINGQFNEMRHLLLKQQFSQKKHRTAENNPLNLLAFMQNDGRIDASFLDLMDGRLDRVPGLLTAFALSCAHLHKIPQFLYYFGPLPQILICAAINDMLPSRMQMTLSTITYTQADVGRRTAVQLIAGMQRKLPIPDRMVVAPQTVVDLQGMTFQTVLQNSRVAYEMALQAVGMCLCMRYTGALACSGAEFGAGNDASAKGLSESARIEQNNLKTPGYTGILDISALCVDVLSDPVFVQSFARLYVRYLPLFQMLPLKTPFSAPQGDEIEVAKRIFEQIRDSLEPMEQRHENLPFTTDFLAYLQLRDPMEIAQLGAALLAPMFAGAYYNPQLLSIYGHLILRSNKPDAALRAFSRALYLDGNDSGAWRGIALVMALKISQEADFSQQNKMRDKILECLDRAAVQPTGYAAIAIAYALLATTAERATMYAIAATKLLQREVYSSLTPVVPFSNISYECDFANAQQTQWYVQRLLAIAAKSCGRAEDVATHMQEALSGMGGAKPGRSIQEIAERILLMTETSQAWMDAGQVSQAEKVIAEGLV